MPACSYCAHSYTRPCEGKDPKCANKRWLDAGNKPASVATPSTDAQAAAGASTATGSSSAGGKRVQRVKLKPKVARVVLKAKPKVKRVPLKR